MWFTTRQKLSLIFSLYVSIFIALIGVISFFVFQGLLIYQIQKDTTLETTEILKNHLSIDKENIIVTPDKAGITLSDEVIEENISVLLLDNQLNVVKGYGLFELYDQKNKQSVETIALIAKEAQKSQTSSQKTISWQEQDLLINVAPIKNAGKNYGIVVIGKSLTPVASLRNIILLSILSFLMISILGSLLLSSFLIKKFFKPVHDLTEIISGVDLDKLDKTLEISGKESDELVIMGKKFNEMITRLKSMSEQQKEFISSASHELKTPLSRAISSFDLALSKPMIDALEITDIRNDLFEINNLLDKLMFLSRLHPGTVLPSEKIELNKLIKLVIESFRDQINEKQITIYLSLDSEVHIIIPREYAKVLISNILSNAIKYSSFNSTIEIYTRIQTLGAQLVIIDHGIGMDKKDLEKIGERFYRSTAGKKISSGYGIGLSIVKRITDLYKIKFFIKSEPGKGTEITLEFPNFS